MKKILKSVLAFVLIVPFAFLLVACGEIKSLEGKTFVFSKVEVTGSLSKEEYETIWALFTLSFDENTVDYSNDVDDEDATMYYKLENGKVYTKYKETDEYDEVLAEVSGKYLIITETFEDGQTAKIYLKQK